MTAILYMMLGAALTLALLWAASRLWSFRAQTAADYEDRGPVFDLREHLNGPIQCEGVIYGPTGRVSSRFVADFDARWEGDSGRMTELFRYDSGATQQREWRLHVLPDGRIRAEADDLVGPGEGEQRGSGLHLRYRIRLPDSAGGHVLDTTDWMYLMENGTIMNRSQVRKFGLKVGELVATMRPKADAIGYRQAAE